MQAFCCCRVGRPKLRNKPPTIMPRVTAMPMPRSASHQVGCLRWRNDDGMMRRVGQRVRVTDPKLVSEPRIPASSKQRHVRASLVKAQKTRSVLCRRDAIRLTGSDHRCESNKNEYLRILAQKKLFLGHFVIQQVYDKITIRSGYRPILQKRA